MVTNSADLDDLLGSFQLLSAEHTEDRHDFLQQAIINNNPEAVAYILMKKIYPDFHQPLCNHYLHLACKMGHVAMVRMIMECRPGDATVRGRVCYPNKCFHTESELDSKLPMSGQPAIDVAVANSQLGCLQAILSALTSTNSKTSHVTSGAKDLLPVTYLCHIGNHQALELLLQSGIPYTQLKLAYYESLIKKRYKCLDVLFKHGYNSYDVRGMNAYHILYQYSSGYNRHPDRHEGLCATTATLLSRSTYPLYSLIDLILKDAFAYGEEYLCETVTRELLSCLKLILRQGVRLDLDEVHVSLGKGEDGEAEPVAFGRELFTSVFDVISVNTGNALAVNLAASEIIHEMVDIILQHNYPRQIKPAHLAGLLHLLVRSHNSKSTSRHLETVIHKLLRLGVNISSPIHESCSLGTSYMTMYLVNLYVKYLCESEHKGLPHTLNDHPVLRVIASSTNHDVLSGALTRYVTRPPLLRLKTLAARVVWFAIDRQCERLSYLPLPRSMKTSAFLDIIIKEI